MTCTSSGSSFPNANAMESFATNNTIIWQEISEIQKAILAASSQCQVGGGQFSTTVSGNTPMTFVDGVRSVDVITGGAGYYIDYPAIQFVSPTQNRGQPGPGVGATGTLVINGSNGSITGIVVSNGGTGYKPVPTTLSITNTTGTGANLTPLVDASGGIYGVSIISTGINYAVGDIIDAVSPNATKIGQINANIRVSSVNNNGGITQITVYTPGNNYSPSFATLKIVDSASPPVNYPIGAGLQVSITVNDSTGAITGVRVINGGIGYFNIEPYLVITNQGYGATTKSTVNLDTHSITKIDVIKGGNGYTNQSTGQVFNPAALPNPTTPATVRINVYENTYGTNPLLYWQTWVGAITNRPISAQLDAVLLYFTNLGYTINIKSNPTTGNTILWQISW